MQTTYPSTMAKGVPGLIADMRHHDTESFAAEAVIPFGAAVVAGTLPEKQVNLPTAAGVAAEVFRGVAVFSHAGAAPATTPAGYPVKAAVPVLRKGLIWVLVSSDVAADADAYVDHVGQDGRFTDVPGASAANGAVIGKFRSAAVSGAIAQLEINLP